MYKIYDATAFGTLGIRDRGLLLVFAFSKRKFVLSVTKLYELIFEINCDEYLMKLKTLTTKFRRRTSWWRRWRR